MGITATLYALKREYFNKGRELFNSRSDNNNFALELFNRRSDNNNFALLPLLHLIEDNAIKSIYLGKAFRGMPQVLAGYNMITKTERKSLNSMIHGRLYIDKCPDYWYINNAEIIEIYQILKFYNFRDERIFLKAFLYNATNINGNVLERFKVYLADDRISWRDKAEEIKGHRFNRENNYVTQFEEALFYLSFYYQYYPELEDFFEFCTKEDDIWVLQRIA